MNDNNKNSWLGVVASVCAAAFGVQSKKNLDRDFNKSTVIPFIIVGLLFTVLFVLGVMAVVKMVLPET